MKTKEFQLAVCEDVAKSFTEEKCSFAIHAVDMYAYYMQLKDSVCFGTVIAFRELGSDTRWEVIDVRNGWGVYFHEFINIHTKRQITLEDITIHLEAQMQDCMNKIDNYKVVSAALDKYKNTK